MLPGLLLTGLFIITAVGISWWKKYPRQEPANWAECWIRFRQNGAVLGMPVAVLGAIYSGILTVTEAALAGIFYALFLQVAFYRKLTVKGFVEARPADLDDLFDHRHRIHVLGVGSGRGPNDTLSGHDDFHTTGILAGFARDGRWMSTLQTTERDPSSDVDRTRG